MNILEYAIAKKMFGGSGGTTDDSIIGTWVFNDDVNLATLTDGEMCFVSAGKTYIAVAGRQYGPHAARNSLAYRESQILETYDVVYMDNSVEVYGATAGWQDEAYKTISILTEPSAEAEAWIRANAVKRESIPTYLPFAYKLSSTDELPIYAPDGSSAVVETHSELLGWWQFNDEISLDGNSSNIHFRFDGASNEYTTITRDGKLVYINEDGKEVTAYENGVWSSEFHKEIDLMGRVEGEYYSQFKTWLNENATHTAPALVHTLYSRENGSWVSKGEI